MAIIKLTNGRIIGRVTLADEDGTRRAIAAAKRAFLAYGRTTKDERLKIVRRLHEAAFANIDGLTAIPPCVIPLSWLHRLDERTDAR